MMVFLEMTCSRPGLEPGKHLSNEKGFSHLPYLVKTY